jgi:hypothetical protein
MLSLTIFFACFPQDVAAITRRRHGLSTDSASGRSFNKLMTEAIIPVLRRESC